MNPVLWLSLGVISQERQLRRALGPRGSGPPKVGESATLDLMLGMLSVASRVRRRFGHGVPDPSTPVDTLPTGASR